MKEHVKAMSEAIDEGVDLMGYTWWGCIDLVSAGTGEIRKRYGFIYVDVDDFGNGTYKRYKKDSFEYCKKVYTSNGEDIDQEEQKMGFPKGFLWGGSISAAQIERCV